MTEFNADVTVVGSGIAGLWSAKELIDRGFTVTIVEKSETLVDGSTTRNEGWLHAGTYHAVATEKEDEVASITANTLWSHEEITRFAPESIDHETTYALALTDDLANKAVSRWERAGVAFKTVAKNDIPDPQIDVSRISAAFKVADKSINTRVLCQKLASYISDRGGTFLTSANFVPENTRIATVKQGDLEHILRSDRFLITAGTGIKEIIERITDQELVMRFFKAHLLVLPRLTENNYFHLEASEAGFMNHDFVSVAGINRDGIESTTPDYDIVPQKTELIHQALTRMIPSTADYPLSGGQVMSVACSKPDLGGLGSTQSLDVHIFEPTPGYVCAVPGKMTMAPYLGKKVIETLLSDNPEIQVPRPTASVTLRPADQWMFRQP